MTQSTTRMYQPMQRCSQLLVFAALAFGFANQASAEPGESAPRILVTGHGTAELQPDTAVLQLTVTREAQTARAALDANSAAMKEVLSAMQAEGIAERDLQTDNFAIQPNYVYPNPQASGERDPPRIVGYTVRNSLTVKVRELGRVGTILDTSVSLGVNEGGSIQLTNEDPSAALAEARTKAVTDAIARARTLAEAAGVKRGKILEISEQSFDPHPRPLARAGFAMAESADGASVPIAGGENSYQVTVSVAFAIEQ